MFYNIDPNEEGILVDHTEDGIYINQKRPTSAYAFNLRRRRGRSIFSSLFPLPLLIVFFSGVYFTHFASHCSLQLVL
jgi:hypothetical protein